MQSHRKRRTTPKKHRLDVVDPSILQKSVFSRGFAPFSALLQSLGQRPKFRVPLIPEHRNRGKTVPTGRDLELWVCAAATGLPSAAVRPGTPSF